MTADKKPSTATRATAMLRGKVIYEVKLPKQGTVLIECTDGTRFFVDAVRRAGADLSIAVGPEEYEQAAFAQGMYGDLDRGYLEWTSPVSEDLIRHALLGSELHYGSQFLLRTASNRLVDATSTWGPVGRDQPGKFIVLLDDNEIGSELTRKQVLQYFAAALNDRFDPTWRSR